MHNELTGVEDIALTSLVAQSSNSGAAKRAVCKTAAELMSLADGQEVDLGEILVSMSQGAREKGDKILLKVTGTLVSYLSSWGVLLLFALGLYQAVQTAKATAAGFMTMVNKALAFAAPLAGIRSSLGGAVSRFFKDSTQEQDPATGLQAVGTLVMSEVPLFGVIMRSLESAIVTPIGKDAARSVNNQLGGAGYDESEYDEEEDADEEEVSFMLDEAGNERDADSFQEGEIAYDEDHNRYVVQNGDFVQHDIAYDIAYDDGGHRE